MRIVNARLHGQDGLVQIAVDGAQISGITPQTGDVTADGDDVHDAAGGTVIPGLIDAHFHAYGVELEILPINARPLSFVAVKGAWRLGRALARGVTTVRDVAGGDPGLRDAITSGLIPSPAYLYTGPALSQTGGHGDEHLGDRDLCAEHDHMGEVVDGVDAVRKAVRQRFRAGAHAIKVMASGGVVSPTDPIRLAQYSQEELRAICEEAARRDSYVCAHAYPPVAIQHAVSAGVRSIEHGNLLDEETAQMMAESGAFLVPTLAAYDAMNRRGAEAGLGPEGMAKNREVLEAGKEAARIALRAGVSVAWGTDLMGDLEDEQLRGIELQVEAIGLDAALTSATETSARLLRLFDRGVIAVGTRADLLVLPGVLAEDPSLLWTEAPGRTVIQAGTIVARDGALVEARAHVPSGSASPIERTTTDHSR